MSLTTIERRANRKRRIRARVIGSTERPRLTVFLSLKRITAQIIDDSTSSTLVAAISKDGKNMKAATSVGSAIAAKAKEKGITQIVFDRNARKYHGRVKALAEAARKGGLIF